MNYINNQAGKIGQRLLSTNFAGTALEGAPENADHYAIGILVDGEDFAAYDLPDADDKATDGSSTVRQYNLDECTVFVESGENDGLHLYPLGTTIQDLLLDGWDTGGLERPEFLAYWGLEGTPDEAPADATNVRVWCEPNYYAGTLGAPRGHFVTDGDSHEPLVFSTVQDAQDWIDDKESEAYCLGHGEAERPAYTITA